MIERAPRRLQNFKATGESDLQRSIDKARESSGRFNPIIWILVAVGLIQVSVSIDSLVSPSLESSRRQISSIQETDSGPLGSTLNVILSPRLTPALVAQVIWTWRLSSIYPPQGWCSAKL
jgi:hypothetical protein